MTSNCINFEYAKLYVAITNLKSNDRRNITKELTEFKNICSSCFTLVNASSPPYRSMYKAQIKDSPMDLPILYKFFSDIKTFSEEAYQFITEGYDILNLKEFLACENLSLRETSEVIWGVYSYSKYIAYALEKLLNEENFEKQRIMLRGLTGTV